MKHRVVTFAAASLVATTANAVERDVTPYPNGVETFGVGIMPGPGTYYLNNTMYYTAGRLNNSNGASSIPNFQTNVIANSFRFDEVWPVEVLGGNLQSRIILPLVNIDTQAAGRHQDRFGLANVTVAPVVLGWHAGELHWTTGMDINVPIGSFNKTDLVNVIENYVQFEPHLDITFSKPGGPEFDIKLMYDFNTIDQATHYHSGETFHTDFAAGWNFDKLTIGVVGYYLTQTTSDTISGGIVPPSGNYTRAFALGPGLRYAWSRIRMQANWKHELWAENHAQGNSFWLRLLIPF